MNRSSKSLLRRLLPAAAVVVVLLVVVLDTTFVSRAEFRELNPPEFDAKAFAGEQMPKIAADVARMATDITELAPAIDRDLAAAGQQYGQSLGSGQFSFPLKAAGTVAEADQDFVLLDVPGVPKGTEVRIPLGTALNGTPVRDCTGTIAYGDFADQTEYQSVAHQLKLLMRREVLPQLDVGRLEGRRITVEGCWNTGGPPRSFIVQPTRIEVGS